MSKQIVCKACVMDRSASEIIFDENGICSYCHQAQKSLEEIETDKLNLMQYIERIKKDGKNKKYDCLIGVSGGADSSTTLHYAIQFGLRPLCYNVDNGYNRGSEADENVLKIIEKLKVPFFRYTINLERFRELQAAFMRAGQINIEIPSDHLIMATSYELASKYGIKWIISGGNVATESILPGSWGYQPRDLVHIRDIYRWLHGKELKDLPTCGLLKFNYYKWVKRIKIFYLLDYLDYHREKATELLEREYGYKRYGEKHCESVITWWFQSFWLFEKFGIDKRKAHYSSLINSGQMTRTEAMEKLKESPVYPKLGFEERAMKYPKRPYTDFKTDERLYNFLCRIIRIIPKKWRY